MNKTLGVTIPVAFHSAGNVILNKWVGFRVFIDDRSFVAVPLISNDQRRLANLPEKMLFHCHGTTIISSRGVWERNMDVLKDIVHELAFKMDT